MTVRSKQRWLAGGSRTKWARAPALTGVRFDEPLDAAVEHSPRVERHLAHVHVLGAHLLHHLLVHPITVRARLEDDPREAHRLTRLDVDTRGERLAHLDVEVVADALEVLQRAVLHPQLG